jgi:hypothetical protein
MPINEVSIPDFPSLIFCTGLLDAKRPGVEAKSGFESKR